MHFTDDKRLTTTRLAHEGKITMRRHPLHRFPSLARFAVGAMLLPLVLAACGETAAPTTAPAAAATVAATRPASAAAPTTAPAAATTGSTAATAAPTTAAAAAPAATTASGVPNAAPAASAAPAAAAAAPGAAFGMPLTTKRGEGGPLRVLWWQAPTILNVHLSSGTKDTDASTPVEEPLARITEKSPVPDVAILAAEIPSAQNGQLAADGTSVTWKLKSGVTWSDGMPFTAEDVKFTGEYTADPKNGTTTQSAYSDIKQIDVIDATTVKITFKAATAAWYLPFVGDNGVILPKHLVQPCVAAGMSAMCPYNLKPVGTGPYVVSDFRPGDSVQYKVNEKFREANAPYFASIDWKGGGDAGTAAKALQTGQVDYAWNLQSTPEVIKQLSDAGKTVATPAGFYVEQLRINYADPKDTGGETSNAMSKNPFFSDPKVVEAFKVAIDRESIAKNLYGAGGAAGNTTIPIIRGDLGKPFEYNPAKANMLLDEAGWRRGADGTREKGGVKFNITFRSSITPVRDRTAQIMQQNFRMLGIGFENKSVDSSIYFGRPDNPDSSKRFTVDLQMLSTGSSRPDSQAFFEDFTSSQFSTKANNWGPGNYMKWSNAMFDTFHDQYKKELNIEKRKTLQRQLDDLVIDSGTAIPLVIRKDVFGYRADLTNIEFSPFSSQVWNIAHWTIKK